jgi:transcriptional regulator with XRE-family HTH domain
MIQTIGRKIAAYRNDLGWTQQYLAERLAISRVAVSHIEMDISIPGERTIVLLAGLFKVAPHELAADTTYPQAKNDRLPLVACCYTALELDLSLMENDLCWLKRINSLPQSAQFRKEIMNKWKSRISHWRSTALDTHEKSLLEKLNKGLNYFQSSIK